MSIKIISQNQKEGTAQIVVHEKDLNDVTRSRTLHVHSVKGEEGVFADVSGIQYKVE